MSTHTHTHTCKHTRAHTLATRARGGQCRRLGTHFVVIHQSIACACGDLARARRAFVVVDARNACRRERHTCQLIAVQFEVPAGATRGGPSQSSYMPRRACHGACLRASAPLCEWCALWSPYTHRHTDTPSHQSTDTRHRQTLTRTHTHAAVPHMNTRVPRACQRTTGIPRHGHVCARERVCVCVCVCVRVGNHITCPPSAPPLSLPLPFSSLPLSLSRFKVYVLSIV